MLTQFKNLKNRRTFDSINNLTVRGYIYSTVLVVVLLVQLRVRDQLYEWRTTVELRSTAEPQPSTSFHWLLATFNTARTQKSDSELRASKLPETHSMMSGM